MKHLKIILIGCFTFFSISLHAGTGSFFNISESGRPLSNPLEAVLCLNGNGPVTCQNYTISRERLSIRTVVPNRTYPVAGIKISASGYRYQGCRLNSQEYCLFAVRDTTSTVITIRPGGRPPPPGP